jgi:hypothetical protein
MKGDLLASSQPISHCEKRRRVTFHFNMKGDPCEMKGDGYPFDFAARSGRSERTTVPACHISLSAISFSSFSSCWR